MIDDAFSPTEVALERVQIGEQIILLPGQPEGLLAIIRKFCFCHRITFTLADPFAGPWIHTRHGFPDFCCVLPAAGTEIQQKDQAEQS